MHSNSFGVVWAVLLVLLGQNILELMCFIFIVVNTYKLFSEYNHAGELNYGDEEKPFKEGCLETPYAPLVAQ